jgi:prevent-host-death family protein
VTTITLQEAQARLAELVRRLADGSEVTITADEQPVARLIGIPAARRTPRPRPPVTGVPRAGRYEGRLVVPDDFDEPLEDLHEYTE